MLYHLTRVWQSSQQLCPREPNKPAHKCTSECHRQPSFHQRLPAPGFFPTLHPVKGIWLKPFETNGSSKIPELRSTQEDQHNGFVSGRMVKLKGAERAFTRRTETIERTKLHGFTNVL